MNSQSNLRQYLKKGYPSESPLILPFQLIMNLRVYLLEINFLQLSMVSPFIDGFNVTMWWCVEDLTQFNSSDCYS